MLLEVSSVSHDASFHKAEQQLLSLRKVYLWFESNKHVLMKSDGVSYFSLLFTKFFLIFRPIFFLT